MKLETWLRIAGVPYEVGVADLALAPKGKVPYVEDGDLRMGDSTLIIDHLVATRGEDPDECLSRSERATSLAFRRMLKESFYWVIIQTRYRDEANWPTYRELICGVLDGPPPEARPAVADMFRDRIIAQLQGHGMGLHSAEEITRIGNAELSAVSEFLGEKPFFMGDAPTTADATVYSHVANLIEVPLESPIREHGRSLANLVRYCERMRERYFPELPPR